MEFKPSYCQVASQTFKSRFWSLAAWDCGAWAPGHHVGHDTVPIKIEYRCQTVGRHGIPVTQTSVLVWIDIGKHGHFHWALLGFRLHTPGLGRLMVLGSHLVGYQFQDFPCLKLNTEWILLNTVCWSFMGNQCKSFTTWTVFRVQ
jgi:hypothetical protein